MQLLDANVFIQAKNTYMHFDIVPDFWDWIVAQHQCGHVGSVSKVRQELLAKQDELAAWVNRLPPGFFKVPDARTFAYMRKLSVWATSHPHYTQAAAQVFFASADYELAAYGAAHGCTVVTLENSEPASKKRILLPDACIQLGAKWEDPYKWIRRETPKFGFGRSAQN